MTFVVKHRGTPRPVRKDFRCPVHGVFTRLVDSETERVRCREFTLMSEEDPEQGGDFCEEWSPWSPSLIPMRMRRVEATKGKDEAPEHPDWNFQRNLEEGQDPDEYEADREAAAERRREQLVVDAARSE